MTDLKTKIARGEYEIDSGEVAEAIITKFRTVHRVRMQMEQPRTVRARRPADDVDARSGERRRATH